MTFRKIISIKIPTQKFIESRYSSPQWEIFPHQFSRVPRGVPPAPRRRVSRSTKVPRRPRSRSSRRRPTRTLRCLPDSASAIPENPSTPEVQRLRPRSSLRNSQIPPEDASHRRRPCLLSSAHSFSKGDRKRRNHPPQPNNISPSRLALLLLLRSSTSIHFLTYDPTLEHIRRTYASALFEKCCQSLDESRLLSVWLFHTVARSLLRMSGGCRHQSRSASRDVMPYKTVFVGGGVLHGSRSRPLATAQSCPSNLRVPLCLFMRTPLDPPPLQSSNVLCPSSGLTIIIYCSERKTLYY